MVEGVVENGQLTETHPFSFINTRLKESFGAIALLGFFLTTITQEDPDEKPDNRANSPVWQQGT